MIGKHRDEQVAGYSVIALISISCGKGAELRNRIVAEVAMESPPRERVRFDIPSDAVWCAKRDRTKGSTQVLAKPFRHG